MKMCDYIKRSDAIREAVEASEKWDDEWNSGYREELIIAHLDDIQAADVRENVRGRWLHKENYDGEWICSLCTADLAFVYGRESGLPNFCPNCGAEMRG